MRSFGLALLLSLVVLPAFAQQPAQEYTLKVNQQDLASLGQAIQELPFKVAQPLMAKLQAQIQEQSKPSAPAEQPKEGEAK